MDRLGFLFTGKKTIFYFAGQGKIKLPEIRRGEEYFMTYPG
jgi:hypothetical protein